eukprot:Skav210726  [mRNA]  locus=scaffold849:250679:270239:+ [translate_table: standard]
MDLGSSSKPKSASGNSEGAGDGGSNSSHSTLPSSPTKTYLYSKVKSALSFNSSRTGRGTCHRGNCDAWVSKTTVATMGIPVSKTWAFTNHFQHIARPGTAAITLKRQLYRHG